MVGFSPLVPLAAAASSSAAANKLDNDPSNDTQGPDSLMGSVYLGFGRDNRETLFGMTWYGFLFDLNWQTRLYLDAPAGGPFAGTFVSAEVFHAGIGRTEAGQLSIGSTGDTVWSAGLRVGGNLGWRFRFGGFGLTPQVGLTLPLEYVWLPASVPAGDRSEATLLTLATRIPEIGLTIEFYP